MVQMEESNVARGENTRWSDQQFTHTLIPRANLEPPSTWCTWRKPTQTQENIPSPHGKLQNWKQSWNLS